MKRPPLTGPESARSGSGAVSTSSSPATHTACHRHGPATCGMQRSSRILSDWEPLIFSVESPGSRHARPVPPFPGCVHFSVTRTRGQYCASAARNAAVRPCSCIHARSEHLRSGPSTPMYPPRRHPPAIVDPDASTATPPRRRPFPRTSGSRLQRVALVEDVAASSRDDFHGVAAMRRPAVPVVLPR